MIFITQLFYQHEKLCYSDLTQIHVSQICSLNDKSVLNNTPEPFFVLSLPIPEEIKNPSLYQCFQEHTKSEILKDENAWFNEKTNQKQDIEKKIIFWSLPQILIIHLKRFHFTGRKINKNIIVPLSLDLNDLVKSFVETKKRISDQSTAFEIR